jgi:hypothetical protein
MSPMAERRRRTALGLGGLLLVMLGIAGPAVQGRSAVQRPEASFWRRAVAALVPLPSTRCCGVPNVDQTAEPCEAQLVSAV